SSSLTQMYTLSLHDALPISKAEIEDYCHTYQLSPRIDPTNFEQIYTRNKIRHTILPTLKEVNSNVHTTIQRLSETLQEDELYLLDRKSTRLNSSHVSISYAV